jgi:hypothetical protein
VALLYDFAKRLKSATTFTVDVVAPRTYLEEVPDEFYSTAF